MKLSIITQVALISMTCATTSLAGEHSGGDWTGVYAGVQVGISNAEVSAGGASIDDSGTIFGLHIGYNHHMGRGFILGGEIDYNTAEYSYAGITVDNDTTRLKLRAGYALSYVMLYGLVGVNRMDDGTDSEMGHTLGLGASFKATDNIIVSGEFTRDSVNFSGIDIDIDAFTLRASFKF